MNASDFAQLISATSEFDPLSWEHRIGYFNPARKARVSRSVSHSFDRKM
jgi:hypothetical protein